MKKVLSVATLAGIGLLQGWASLHAATTDAATAGRPAAVMRPVPDRQVVAGPDNSCDPNGICLAVTVGADLDPAACATTPSLEASAGDRVNFCYTVTNHSQVTYNFQTLSDDSTDPDQQFLLSLAQPLAPGESYQYNRIVTVGSANLRSTATWTAVAQLPNYSYDDTASFDFVDITTQGRALDLGYNGQLAVALPFPVTFYGAPSRRLTVGSNGAIGFGADTSALISSFDTALPTASAGGTGLYPLIAPLWMGLDPRGGAIYTATLGTAPNRRFVVEWYDRPVLTPGSTPQPDGATFEVVFTEGSDQILFQYLDTSFNDPVNDHGAKASIGLNWGMMPDGTLGVATQYSHDAASLHDGQAIRWTPSSVASSRSSAWAGVSVGMPAIRVDRTALNAQVDPGSSTSTTLQIGNYGNRALNYEVGSRSAAAHVPTGARAAATAPASNGMQPSLTSVAQLTPEQIDWMRRVQAMHAATASSASTAPLAAAGVPAYANAVTFNLGTLLGYLNGVGFDLQNPQTIAKSSYTMPDELGWSAGDFVGDDLNTVYAVSFNGTLFKMDAASGSTTVIGGTGLASNRGIVTGAAYSSYDHTFYVATSGEDFLARSKLYTLDLATAQPTYVGAISLPGQPGITVTDIAVDTAGAMYGFEGLSKTLIAIDRTSGAANVVGDTGVMTSHIASLDFDDRDGTLYMVAQDESGGGGLPVYKAYSVNVTTGAAGELGTLGAGGELDAYVLWNGGLAIAATGTPCANLADVPWLSAEPSSGAITDYGVTRTVTLTFNNAGTLAAGTYTANLCVNSNDPLHPHVAVPVTLTVGADRIFANGFDG